jgi:homoserine kinase
MSERVISFAPATVGNAGPCYDIIGYALNDVGDFVEVEKVELSKDMLLWNEIIEGPAASQLKNVKYTANSAWIAANRILKRHWNPKGREFSLRMTLHKYLPVGSGIGSSAASAVAGVKAVVEMMRMNLPENEIVESLELGEEATNGTGYPDNVVPSYFGGLYLINESDVGDGFKHGGKRYIKIDGGQNMVSIIVRPNVPLTVGNTGVARTAVKKYVYHEYVDPENIDPDSEQAAINILNLVRRQSAKSCELLIRYMQNDIARVGAILRDNPLLEGARSQLIPNFLRVKRAAMDAGSYGCTISGAGPAVVAITDSNEAAIQIRDSIRKAFEPTETQWLISNVNYKGASIINSIEDFIHKAHSSNSFYDYHKRA